MAGKVIEAESRMLGSRGWHRGGEGKMASCLMQRSPTFLAPTTSFMEDSLPMDRGGGYGFRMIQAHCIYCALYFYYYYITTVPQIIRH